MNYYLILDVETGGKNEKENPITEIALSMLDPKTLNSLHKYQCFVKPYNNLVITQEALDATQITMKNIESGIDIKDAIKELATIMMKYSSKTGRYKPVLIGHNIGFDQRFLKEAFEFVGKSLWDFIDPVLIDTMFEQRRIEYGKKDADKNLYSLGACCNRMGIKLHSAHGAEADVEATEQLYFSQLNILRNGGNNTDAAKDNRQSKKAKARTFFEM